MRTYEPNRGFKDCDCSGITSIQNALISNDKQHWNVICDDFYDLNAYVYAVGQQWITYSLKNVII